MRSAVTISLVPEARGGPFVFWDDLDAACRTAAELGFDAIELFPPSAEAVAESALRPLLAQYGLRLAAMGTGAGWVVHHLHVNHVKTSERRRAGAFIKSIIDTAGAFGAPAIMGSMQGRWSEKWDARLARDNLAARLAEFGDRAAKHGVPFLYEPLNRYETNLVNTIAQGVELLESIPTSNVRLLADLFHMNIEEQDVAKSIRAAGGRWIGHVHLADSNRRPAGCGHTDFGPVAAALREVGYAGYVSAECLPYPNPDEAARQTIAAFNRHFRGT